MEAYSFANLLSVLAVALSFFLIFFLQRPKSAVPQGPPGAGRWSLIGEGLAFAVSGPQKFLSERMKKFSPEIFQTFLMGKKMVVFCGPKGNKFLLTNYKIFTSWWPESLKKVLIFPSFEGNSMEEVAPLLKNYLHENFKPEVLKHYIPIMDSMACEHLESEWAPNSEVKVYPLVKKYTFALTCRLFMNVDDPDDLKALAGPFKLVTSGMSTMPINLPGTAYNRAIKAGKLVRYELLKIIRRRKVEVIENKGDTMMIGQDLLSKMLMVTDENGQLLSDMVMSNNIIGLLVGSFDTTSTAITFVMKYLAELPNVYSKVFKEQMEIAKSKGPDELLNWNDIQQMKYSWNVACEALRLVPPFQGSFREAVTDFTFAGFSIPKGSKVFWSFYSTNKDPKYFPNPEEFDPSRYEGSGPAPYAFLPFGSGRHSCPGKEFARLMVLTFMHNVVKKFNMERAVMDEKIVFHATPVPVDGLPIRISPHEK